MSDEPALNILLLAAIAWVLIVLEARAARDHTSHEAEALARADELALTVALYAQDAPAQLRKALDAYRATRPNLTPGSASECEFPLCARIKPCCKAPAPPAPT